MPSNGSVPPVRPSAPKGPPPVKGRHWVPPTLTTNKASPPPPPPMRNPSVINDPPAPLRIKLIGFLLLGALVVLGALGMNKTFDDIQVWAKDYDLRHCLGKYDTQQCHQDRADAKARAYINAKGDL